MKELVKRACIWWLVRRARAEYLAYLEALNMLDCGMHVARHLPSVAGPRRRCNRILNALRRLDPVNCPEPLE